LQNNDRFSKLGSESHSGSYILRVEAHWLVLVTLSTVYFLFVYLNY